MKPTYDYLKGRSYENYVTKGTYIYKHKSLTRRILTIVLKALVIVTLYSAFIAGVYLLQVGITRDNVFLFIVVICTAVMMLLLTFFAGINKEQ